jgi:hypothetical protein
MRQWTGSPGAATVTIAIGPAFEGGTVDLLFLAPAGASLGVAGTVTVDGATPPQGPVTLNTSGVSTSGLLTFSPGGTIATAGTTTITGTGTAFTASMIGQLLTSTGGTVTLPAGTYITAVASATSITVNTTPAVGSGGVPTTHGWVPMVKRITGLAAGAHTVTFTTNTSDSVANSILLLYGLGLESQNPTTPIVWCNIARTPAQTGGQQTNATALNAATAAVLNGTATAFGTAEPAFGTNVVLGDIDSALGVSPAYFLADGLHPNSRGHRLIARTVLAKVQGFTTDQLLAR